MKLFKFFKKEKNVEKKVKKAKKKLHVIGLCCAFCLGALTTAVLVYKNKEKLAVMMVGKKHIAHKRLAKLQEKA